MPSTTKAPFPWRLVCRISQALEEQPAGNVRGVTWQTTERLDRLHMDGVDVVVHTVCFCCPPGWESRLIAGLDDVGSFRTDPTYEGEVRIARPGRFFNRWIEPVGVEW